MSRAWREEKNNSNNNNNDNDACRDRWGYWFILAHRGVNPFTPIVSYGDVKVILTFESVDKTLRCDHSNETSSAVLSHGTIYI